MTPLQIDPGAESTDRRHGGLQGRAQLLRPVADPDRQVSPGGGRAAQGGQEGADGRFSRLNDELMTL